MTRFLWAMLIGGLCAVGASAQPPVGPRPLTGANTPPVSPYLNLLRPGTSPAVNYYGLVRPQVNFLGSVQALQAQVGYAQQASALQAGEGMTTGHPVYFLNYQSYFLNTSAQPATAGGPAAPTRPPLGAGLPGTAAGAGLYRPVGR